MQIAHNAYQRESATEQRYKYNGKELQPELGLNWTDYGARMYDASLSRWHVIDALSDTEPSLTPYRYGFNNPINTIDPDGNFEVTFNGKRLRGRAKASLLNSIGIGTNSQNNNEEEEDSENDKGTLLLRVADPRDDSSFGSRLLNRLNPFVKTKFEIDDGDGAIISFDIDEEGFIDLTQPTYTYQINSNYIKVLRDLVRLRRTSGNLAKFVRDSRFFRNNELRNFLSQYYRQGASAGNGSSAVALLQEARTGTLLSNTGHLNKVAAARNFFVRFLRTNSQSLSKFERNFVIRQILEANRAIRVTLSQNSKYIGTIPRETLKTIRKFNY